MKSLSRLLVAKRCLSAIRAIFSRVVFTCDVDEGGHKLCVKENASALLSEVSMHGIVMREVLMIHVDLDVTATYDLGEVFAHFGRC